MDAVNEKRPPETEDAAAGGESGGEGRSVIRTATFGGFNKADVISFIEKQKKTEADLRAKVEELQTKLAGADKNIAELKAALASDENEKYRAEAQEKASALAICEARLKSLQERYDALNAEYEKRAQTPDPAQAEKTAQEIAALTASREQADREIAALRAENETLAHEKAELQAQLADAQSRQTPEGQVAAAIIDARRCADQIIAEAKLREAEINRRAYDTLQRAVASAQTMHSEVAVCIERCDRAVASMQGDIGALKNDLSAEAEKYRQEQE